MMQKINQKNKLAVFFLIIMVALATLNHTAWGSSRRLNVGEIMPQFTSRTLSGDDFSYTHGSNKVLMVVFLTDGQKQSVRGAAEIEKVITQIASEPNSLDIAVVVTNSNEPSFFKSIDAKVKPFFKIIPDTDYKLWGKFGIIVAPTVIIGDKYGKTSWVRPGYGYDFTVTLKSALRKALGIPEDGDQTAQGVVKVIKNTSVSDKAGRHLKMAKMLEEKGRLSSAVKQLESAYLLDPNSTPVTLYLGELLCKTGKGDQALKITEKLKLQARSDQARKILIAGWANRLENNLDIAGQLLLEATKLDPRSARAFFELGKVYESTGSTKKAVTAYRKALSLLL